MTPTPVSSVIAHRVCPALLALGVWVGGHTPTEQPAVDRVDARRGVQPSESSSQAGLEARIVRIWDTELRPPASGSKRVVQGVARIPSSSGDRFEMAPPATGPEDRKPASTAASPMSPIQVYRASCLECHDSDGRGEIARDLFPKVPDFTDSSWQSSRTDAQLSRSILEGKGKSMPRMKVKLGPVDVRQMVAFVRAFRGGNQVVDEESATPEVPGPPISTGNAAAAPTRSVDPLPSVRTDPSGREGARLFQRLCAKCHASDGTGTAVRRVLPAIPDFTLHSWQASRNDAQLMVSVLGGKGTGMPAFGDKLSRAQVRELVSLVRALDPTRGPSAGTSPYQFEVRFRELEEEFERLRQQIRSLSTSDPPARRAAPPHRDSPSSKVEGP